MHFSPFLFLQSKIVQYIIGFIVELFLDLFCVNACLTALLTAILACIQIIGMQRGCIFLLCTSSTPQAYVWYKIHRITLHYVYMLFHINTKCQNKKCMLWATVQWPISFFPHSSCTKHSSYCFPHLLFTPTKRWLTWCQWVDVLWRSLSYNASPECYIMYRESPQHQTCRFSLLDTPWHVTLGSSSCSISLAFCAALREASHHHICQSSLLAPRDTSRSVPRAAASLLRAVLRFARHHTVRRVNRHTWTRYATSISADVTSDRQSRAWSHATCMQCNHNRESPPYAEWHPPTYHQRTTHAATHVVTPLSLPQRTSHGSWAKTQTVCAKQLKNELSQTFNYFTA